MKYALIIANTEYTDPALRALSAPGQDADDLARVLQASDIAAFDDVKILKNDNAASLREAIDDFFSYKQPDDLLLLYFSGHGIRDEFGALYLAVNNTRRERLRSTAIDSSFIRLGMDQSESTKQVIILDCCNSGAFAQGTKGVVGDSMGTREAFEGRGIGRVVLTASDSTQYALEDAHVTRESSNSLFTRFLVKGIEGEADKDDDGKITIDDLYLYVYSQVTRRTSKQTPRKYAYAQEGEIAIRELSEEQKQARAALRLHEQRLREEAEQKRLAEEEARRIQLEEEMQAAQAARQAAEEKTRAMLQQIDEERQRREAVELEIAKRQAALPSPAPTKSRLAPAHLSPAILVILAVVLIAGGWELYATLSNNQGASPTSEPGGTPASTGAAPVAERALDEIPAAAPAFQAALNAPIAADSLEVITPENAKRITGLARWGGPIVHDLAYSPNGNRIAAATAIGIILYDASSLEILKTIETGGWTNCVLFSPDGEMLFSCSEKEGPQAWNADTGNRISNFFDASNQSSVARIAARADGSMLAVGYQYGDVDLFEAEGSYLDTIETDSGEMADLAFSPDGNSLAIISRSSVGLWDIDENGQVSKRFNTTDPSGSNLNGDRVAFSPDGMTLLVVDKYSSAAIWRSSDGVRLQTLYDVGSAVYSPRENILIASTSENDLRALDPSTLSEVRKIAGQAEFLKNLVLAPDGKRVLANSMNRLQIWNLETGKLEASTSEQVETVRNFALSPDGSLLASAQEDDSILVREMYSGAIVHKIDVTDFYVQDMAFLPDGSGLIFWAGQMIFWVDMQSGSVTRRIGSEEDFTNRPQTLAISTDGTKFAYSIESEAFSITVGSVTNGETLQTLADPKADSQYRPYELIFSSDGKTLAALTNERVDLWSLETGKIEKQLQTPDHYAPGFGWLPNGTMAYTLDARIHIADAGGADTAQGFTVPTNGADQIMLSPHGDILMATTYDDFVHLWNFSDGTLITSFLTRGDQYANPMPRFSKDGKLIIISGLDGTLQLWGIGP